MHPSPNVRVSLLSRYGFPLHSVLQRQSSDFWNSHEVRAERILIDIRDESYVRRNLAKLNRDVVRAILEWVEVDEDGLAPEIAALIANHADEIWFETLFLLIEYCENRKHESFRTAATELLGEDKCSEIDGRFEQMQSNRLLLALRVYCEDPNAIKYLGLWDSLDGRSYQRYELLPAEPLLEGNDDKELAAHEILQLICGSLDATKITSEAVDQVLVEFEDHIKSGRLSTCQGVLHTDGGETVWVFIRRQYRENFLTEVSRTIFADEAELIIMRFRSNLREMDIKYQLKDSIEIAGKLASHFLEAKVEYIPASQRTHIAVLQAFTNALVKNGDPRLKIMEVCSADQPLPGAPRIVLHGDKTTGVAEALEQLRNNHGIDLLARLENITYLKLAYTSSIFTRKQTKLVYIVTLHIQQSTEQDQFFVSYSIRAPYRERSNFEGYMSRQYEITVVPRTEVSDT